MELFFANGVLVDTISNTEYVDYSIQFNDRALQYGDGVFETMRIVNGEIPMWGFHQQRLIWAQETLKLPLQDFLSQWDSFRRQNLSLIQNACAKLVISRGVGPRGYKIPRATQLNWWLQVTDLPATKNTSGYSLTLCQHTLSRQPALAGLKHLNRLDQVIARSEWCEQDCFDEGIMFNLDGNVIEGTMSNIFWLKGNQLFTPDLSQEGVDGCVRRWIIENICDYKLDNEINNFPPVIIKKDSKLDQLLSADAVFLTNSLIGVKQVVEIDSQVISRCERAYNFIEHLTDVFNAQFI